MGLQATSGGVVVRDFRKSKGPPSKVALKWLLVQVWLSEEGPNIKALVVIG